MNAEPLTKALHEKLTQSNVKSFTLDFQGGNDEGYLYIDIEAPDGVEVEELTRIIDDWAWSVYEYSGGGDGQDYGDRITYNLETNEVTTQEWYMARTESDEEKHELKTIS